jgi:hypothetical protein
VKIDFRRAELIAALADRHEMRTAGRRVTVLPKAGAAPLVNIGGRSARF